MGKYLDEGKIPPFCHQYRSSSLSTNRSEAFTPRTTGHKDAIGTGNTEMPDNLQNRKRSRNNGREEVGEISHGLLLPCSTEVPAHRCCQVICSDTCLVHRCTRPFPMALTVSYRHAPSPRGHPHRCSDSTPKSLLERATSENLLSEGVSAPRHAAGLRGC